MKKNKLVPFYLLSGLLSFGLLSCEEDPGVSNDTEIPGGNKDDQNKVYSQTEQKAFLDEVGREFNTHVQTSEISKVSDIVSFVKNNLTDDAGYDTKEIEDRLEDCLDAISTEKLDVYTVPYEWGKSVYSSYKKLYRAANFTGRFIAGQNGWDYSTAGNLQFEFRDASGRDCVLKLETSGDMGTAYILTDEDWDYYEYDYENGYYYYTDYINENKIYLQIPENIVVTLTQSGNTLIKVDLQTNISRLLNQTFDLMRTSLDVKIDITIQNLRFNFEQLAYDANSSANLSFKMYHSGTAIFAASAKIDANFSGEGHYDDEDNFDVEIEEAKNAQISVNVLGKVQIKGNVNDVEKLSNFLDRADENEDNGNNFNSYISQAEELVDLNLYYNGGTTPQAKYGFEPREESGYYYSYWVYDSVLRFGDGTSYSTFEAFFNDIDFKLLIKSLENLMDNYESEADKYCN